MSVALKEEESGSNLRSLNSKMEEKKIDIAALMAEIRAKVTADLARNAERRRAFKAKSADPNGGAERSAGELLHSEELRSLNRNHAFSMRINPAAIKSHRAGFLGKVVVAIKRRVMGILRDAILHEYLQAELEFHADLVRYLNELTRYVDNRDASNFWELVRKIEVDLQRAMDRVDRMADDGSSDRFASEKRVGDAIGQLAKDLAELRSDLARNVAETRSIDGAVKGLESLSANLGKVSRAVEPSAEILPSEPKAIDRTYLLFENRFRGSEEEITRRMLPYCDLYKGAPGEVLEIGPGRGELLRLFKQSGVAAFGVDSDPAMVEAATSHGLDVRLGDGIAYLNSVSTGSLGGLIAIQVVEHLPYPVLRELLDSSRRVTKSGGLVVFETINPKSMLALSSNYFRDPTHVAPLHPDTLKFMMELAGFVDVEIRYLSPVSPEAQLKRIEMDEVLTPRWTGVVSGINTTIDQLNSLLFGHQDFCVIGRVK